MLASLLALSALTPSLVTFGLPLSNRSLVEPAPCFANGCLPAGRARFHCAAAAEKQPAGGKSAKRGYRFGDLFINKLTGKDEYEFGDLSRFIDSKVKDAACQLTGKDTYEFGDISRLLDARAKDEVRKLTGKEEYELGDISKEIARRIQAGEVDQEDMSLLIRGVLSFGLGLSPISHLLPVKFLLGFLSFNLQQDIGQRVSSKMSAVVAEELDRRAKGALLGKENEDYVFGDMTKKQLLNAVKAITGKDEYEFGDISKAVAEMVAKSAKENEGQRSSPAHARGSTAGKD